MLAEWTGLEPATPGVTGRYSNQLNYHSRTARCEPTQSRLKRLLVVLTGSNNPRKPLPEANPQILIFSCTNRNTNT